MACGIGACLACVCKSKDVDHHTQRTQQADLQGWSRIFSRGGGIMMTDGRSILRVWSLKTRS